jgi:carbonic anhydrase/acetyltransferase-like protein (isoleucine patch superfamily)
MIYALGDLVPQVHPTAFIAPTATVIGDVVIEENVSIWYGAVLRGDAGRITIGAGSNIQDNAVLHEETTLGRGCTVAHLVLAHNLVAEDNVLIGNGALVFGGCHLGEGSVVGAGAVVTPGTQVPPRTLMLGAPAKPAREVNDALRELITGTAAGYMETRALHVKDLRRISE